MAGCAIFLLTPTRLCGVGAYERDADADGSVAADVADAALQRPGHDACAGGTLVAAYVLDCVYFIPASSYFPLTTPFIEGSIFVGTVCGMLVAAGICQRFGDRER